MRSEQLVNRASQLKGLKLDEAASLVRVFSLAGVDVPKSIMKRFKQLSLVEPRPSASRTEVLVRQQVLEQDVALPDVQFKVFHLSGFEMDIWRPERNLNVELDGPLHGSKCNWDAERDEFLCKRYGIQVKRVDVVGRNVADVVAAVLTHLQNATAVLSHGRESCPRPSPPNSGRASCPSPTPAGDTRTRARPKRVAATARSGAPAGSGRVDRDGPPDALRSWNSCIWFMLALFAGLVVVLK